LPLIRAGIRAQHAGEAITAAEFSVDDIAVRTQRFAQCGDLNLEVLFRYHDIRPHPADELLFGKEQAVGLQEGQKEIESARAELDRNTVREQLPLAQQDAETAKFERSVAYCRARPVRAWQQRVFTPEDGL
jgi:hypothetical protein